MNVDAFDERSLDKAGYTTNPLVDNSLAAYTVYEVPMTSLTMEVGKEAGVKPREAERSKNFFALGLLSWLYSRPTEPTLEWIAKRFAKTPQVLDANTRAFKAGFNFGETAELFESNYQVRPAVHEPGTYTNVTGNTALAWGLIAAAHQAKLPIFLGSYPITPASDILHELAKHKEFGVRTFQAEDEIAGVGAAIGAAFGGSLGITTTSGPGIDLKSESIGMAVSLELPLLIVDIQRGGPSTGLPTKTEQSDLLHAMYGRHGEAPVPIVAAMTPSHCFEAAMEAVRIAVTYRTPVFLLSDGYLANGSEPWRLPEVADLPEMHVEFATEKNHTEADGSQVFWPYIRDENLARPWAVPGTPGLEHRIGGLEKAEGSGNISYDPENHERMVQLRAAKVAGIARSFAASRGRRSRRPRGRLGPRSRLGIDLWGHRRRGPSGEGTRPGRGSRPARPPQSLPLRPRSGPGRLRPRPRPRGQSGPALQNGPGRIPGRRQPALQGPGIALPGGRDRGGRPRDARRRESPHRSGRRGRGFVRRNRP